MKIIEEVNTGDTRIVTIYGNSLETKPTQNISAGSVFIETDTLKKFIFDEVDLQWNEINSVTTELFQGILTRLETLETKVTSIDAALIFLFEQGILNSLFNLEEIPVSYQDLVDTSQT